MSTILSSIYSAAASYLPKLVPPRKTDEQPVLLAQAAPEKKPGAAAQNVLIAWTPFLVQEMNSDDTMNWQKAAWANGDPFNVGWRPDHITFNNGIMTVKLDNAGCPSGCSNKPYASGEYRTKKEDYRYGYYEARLKAGAGDGLVSSFFNYTGTYGQPNHYEIDFEVLGKDCGAVQTNYYLKGAGHHEEMINLPFNACTEFHNYGFKWDQNSVIWYVDGKKVRSESVPTNLPASSSGGKTKIMANFWSGIGVDDWLGPFTYPGRPITAQYDWIKFSPLTQSANQPNVAPEPARSQPAKVSNNALLVNTVAGSPSAWNQGKVALKNGEYTFSASGATDPGFTIFLGALDVSKYKTLKFEIKGTLEGERFIGQIYKVGDSSSVPSIQSTVPLSGESSTFEIPLKGASEVEKIQFLGVHSSVTCNVIIKNLRFE